MSTPTVKQARPHADPLRRELLRARLRARAGVINNAEFDRLPVHVQDALTDPVPLPQPEQPPPRYDKDFWVIMELLNADARGE